MAIFVANLAFVDASLVTSAKTAILSASTLSGILGYLFLRHQVVKEAHRQAQVERA
jgi:Na+:H+ antiporter, NhaA family